MTAAARILLVEDDPADAARVRSLLDAGHPTGLEIDQVDSLDAARRRLDEVRYNAVLLDLHLPGRVGLDSLREVLAFAPDLPVVVLTGMNDEELGVQAVQEGAQDYLTKDQINRPLLVRALRHAMERQQTRAELRALAMTDPLTGVYNRRGFFRMGRQLMELATRTGTPVALLFADVDDLKRVNDTHGHVAGDRILARVGRLLRSTYRQSDVLGRLGGDEFAVLGQVDPGAEEDFVSRLEEVVARAEENERIPMSLAVGGAVSSADHPMNLDELLRVADADMLDKKQRVGGREGEGG